MKWLLLNTYASQGFWAWISEGALCWRPKNERTPRRLVLYFCKECSDSLEVGGGDNYLSWQQPSSKKTLEMLELLPRLELKRCFSLPFFFYHLLELVCHRTGQDVMLWNFPWCWWDRMRTIAVVCLNFLILKESPGFWKIGRLWRRFAL